MTQSPAVRLITELALANKGFVTLPEGGVDGNALVKSGSGLVWGSGAGGTAVNSVNSRTGNVLLNKTDVALGNVDNTADLAKPVSAATQIALNAKADYPANGSDGQVLTKSGLTTSWTTVSGGGSGGSGPAIIAPSPSGGDDTALLQSLLNQAQNSGGTLLLRAGTYRANLVTGALFQQPLIVGQGRYMTTIQPVTTAPVVTFRGGSGTLAGGGLRSLQLKGPSSSTGTGLEYNGCGGVDSLDVDIQGFSVGVRFHNEVGSDFTEFDTFQGAIEGCTTPVHYKVDNSVPSFHGSGLVGNTIVNLVTATTTAVQIDPAAFPYNAPMSATFFPNGSGNQNIITNFNTGRIASFYGTLRAEGNWANVGSGSRIFLTGTVSVLGQSGSATRLGTLYLVDKAYYNGGNTLALYRPVQRSMTLGGGTTTIFPDNINSCMVQVDLIAVNYHYAYLLHCWQSPYDPTGVVSILANPKALNTAGLGAPTFGWSNYGLTVTNASYSSAVTAHVTATQMTPSVSNDVLGQV